MKKQKKNFLQNENLTQKQLRNRWIIITIGLITLLLILTTFIIMYFLGKVDISFYPSFARAYNIDSSAGSKENKEQINQYVNLYNDYDYEELYNIQTSKPEQGEEIVEIYIEGFNKQIRAKLFDKEVPEIVNKFKDLVKSGYYNKQKILVKKDILLKTNIINEKESNLDNNISWDSLEVKTNKVLPYNGALCADALVKNDKICSADFFIMNIKSNKVTNLENYNIPIQLRKLFEKHGGDPIFVSDSLKKPEYLQKNIYANLLDYLKHPTFGHVFEGMELIEEIVKTGKTYIINKMEIVKYEE